jgi:putative tryptophan/tyrosine transport system substrate-binding protein
MRRREFITLLGGGVATCPLAARAQQGRVRRVGVLAANTYGGRGGQLFREALADLGWVEGRNLRIDVRLIDGDVALARSYARELVALAPDVILAGNTIITQALRDATRTIPIVFVTLTDPVSTGVVSNLARPEANVTGFMQWEYSIAGKWLSLLKDMAPRIRRVAVLFDPDGTPYGPFYVKAAQDAGERLSVAVTAASVRDTAGIEPAIAAGSDDGGLLVPPQGGFISSIRATMIALAAKYRVPAIFYDRRFPADGGLMSYAADQQFQYRDSATYVDRILRGAKPSDLPVQFATKFELVINLKTARALGLTVSQNLLSIADEVIE